jgi:hypothetical protein
MALELTTASTDRITHGTGLGAFTAGSFAGWFYPTALANFQSFLFLQGASGFQSPSLTIRNTDELAVAWRHGGGGTNLLYVTSAVNIAVNKWWFIAMSVDQAGAAGAKAQIYVGDLWSLAVAQALATTTDASDYNSNSGGTFQVGDNGADSAAVGGSYAWVGAWPGRVLNLADIRALQLQTMPGKAAGQNPREIPGCKLWVNYIHGGSATQRDQSGHGNHGTPTGCVAVTEHPLNLLSWDAWDDDDLADVKDMIAMGFIPFARS